MSELIAFVFRDQYRAPEVLNELRRRNWPWVQDLEDAVVITLDEGGKARVHLTVDPAKGEAVRWARLWSSLLTKTLFYPLTEVMNGAANGLQVSSNRLSRSPHKVADETKEETWWRESLKQSENFQRDVGALLIPKGSAIFMLLRTEKAPVVLKQLRNYGDMIVHTSVSSEQDNEMRAMFATS